MKIFIILGTTRKNRASEEIGNWVTHELPKNPDGEIEVIDLRDYPLPFFDEAISPAYLGGKYSSDIARKWVKKIAEADGYIILTPEYNRGYPAVLKNALDYAYAEWNTKPVAFISYGGAAGGARAVEQLRLVAIELQMIPIRNGVHIVYYSLLRDEKGKLKLDAYKEPLANLYKQLLWFTEVLRKSRKQQK